jgi:hypothetical protein
MADFNLTKVIEADIAKYDRRIMRLKCQLQDTRGNSRKDRKKIDMLYHEIKHVQGLRQMAVDALNDVPVNQLSKGASK